MLAVGMALSRRDGRTMLVPLPRQRLTQDLVTDLVRDTVTRARVSKADVRVLYAVHHGATEKALRADAGGHLRTGRLVNAGLLVRPDKQNQPMQLSPEVRFSLGLDDA
jgi:hypothetical protein